MFLQCTGDRVLWMRFVWVHFIQMLMFRVFRAASPRKLQLAAVLDAFFRVFVRLSKLSIDNIIHQF